MRRSKAEVYLHLVWATHNRRPWLTPDLTPIVYDAITRVARRLKVTILAVGGMPDHVHLLVLLPPSQNIAQFAGQVKGASSRLAGETSDAPFQWQEGYGVFSVSPSHVPRVLAYVRDQPRRHGIHHIWPDWEETDEESPPFPITRPPEGRSLSERDLSPRSSP